MPHHHHAPVTRAQFVETCRALIGTPYLHQGRDPQFGLDCLGLVEYAASLCGMLTPEQFTKNYSRHPSRERLLEKGLGARLLLVATAETADERLQLLDAVRDADLLLIRWGVLPAHVAVAATEEISGRRTMIHAFQNRSKSESWVTEETLTRFGDYIVAAYAWPEVKN